LLLLFSLFISILLNFLTKDTTDTIIASHKKMFNMCKRIKGNTSRIYYTRI